MPTGKSKTKPSTPTNQKTGRGCQERLVEPLHCPFCGSNAVRVKGMPKREHDRMAFMAVECQSCGAWGPVSAGVDSQKAIRKWNDQIGWQCMGSARYILEDANPEKLAEACGLPLGVITAALKNILLNAEAIRSAGESTPTK